MCKRSFAQANEGLRNRTDVRSASDTDQSSGLYLALSVQAGATEVGPLLLRAIRKSDRAEKAIGFLERMPRFRRRSISRRCKGGSGSKAKNSDRRDDFDHLIPNSTGQRSLRLIVPAITRHSALLLIPRWGLLESSERKCAPANQRAQRVEAPIWRMRKLTNSSY